MDGSIRKSLIDVAQGRAPADLVLANGRLLNVHTRELLHVDIVIRSGRIAAVAKAGDHAWQASARRDLEGRFVSPGFMDPHIHIEGSLVTTTEFARAVVPRGVTLVAHDPHEIGNVLGLAGIRLMMEEAKAVPLRVLLRVPGRIPGYGEALETSNGEVTLDDTAALLALPEAVCLAGDYNPQWILRGDGEQLAKVDFTSKLNKTVSGQPAGVRGRSLCGYVAAGLEDSHVASSLDEIIENQCLGLRTSLVMRQGRRLGREHVRELAELIRKTGFETRFIQLSTDEVYPHDLISEGHLDQRIRMCVEEGIDVATAYQWATLNVAEGLRIDRDFGSVSPGKYADLVVLDNLEKVDVSATMIGGEFRYEGGRYKAGAASYAYPAAACDTIRLARKLQPEDFQIRVGADQCSVQVRAIITDAPKRQEDATLQVRQGVVMPDDTYSSLAMVECHRGNGNIGLAFVGGLHLERGAIASTVSHDAHNMLLIGASHSDMAVAANRLAEIGGGYIIVLDGNVLLELALPVAGLMSSDRIEDVAAKVAEFERILFGTLGCPMASQIMMRFNGLSMANAASCGFSDRGLIDSASMQIVDAVVASSMDHMSVAQG
ncbi:adenine deaminase C-terminal domain-containing protein [Roseiarcaceae bacterium H3SJ34-1]|uniref:adenine deaminase C-terminal domain-containing protein n=1 Tax=Terripilifer ovatus TaxID=3032367 RepID=UPI003AB92465|nr:adenine deaminase C-terminal domain-containing protein [Roseiarcaceae bacterium H3SJ34-1]